MSIKSRFSEQRPSLENLMYFLGAGAGIDAARSLNPSTLIHPAHTKYLINSRAP